MNNNNGVLVEFILFRFLQSFLNERQEVPTRILFLKKETPWRNWSCFILPHYVTTCSWILLPLGLLKGFSMSFHRVKQEIGELVLAKFNYQCQKCGSSYDLCVHHKISMKPNDKRYNDPSNLIVLCRSCHMAHHRNKGDLHTPPPPPGNPFGRRGKGPPVKCKIFGCNNFQHAKKLCHKHYMRRLRRKV